jgi:hypothetical protein
MIVVFDAVSVGFRIVGGCRELILDVTRFTCRRFGLSISFDHGTCIIASSRFLDEESFRVSLTLARRMGLQARTLIRSQPGETWKVR